MEVYAGWCGTCTAALPTLKKLHWDLVEERSAAVNFVECNSDNIEALKVGLVAPSAALCSLSSLMTGLG